MVNVKDVVVKRTTDERIVITVKGKNLIILINEDGNSITNINSARIDVFKTDKIRNLQDKEMRIFEVEKLYSLVT